MLYSIFVDVILLLTKQFSRRFKSKTLSRGKEILQKTFSMMITYV